MTELTDDPAQTASVDAYLEVTTAGTYTFVVSCDGRHRRRPALRPPDRRAAAGHHGRRRRGARSRRRGPEPRHDLPPPPRRHRDRRWRGRRSRCRARTCRRATSTGSPAIPATRSSGSGGRTCCWTRRCGWPPRRELTEPELRHVLTHPGDFDGLSLGAAAGHRDRGRSRAAATALFGQVRRLLDLRRAAPRHGRRPGELTDLFAYARQTYPADLDHGGQRGGRCSPTSMPGGGPDPPGHERPWPTPRTGSGSCAATARADGDLISAVCPALVNEIGLRRLWTVLALAERLGITPGVLADGPPRRRRARPSARAAARRGAGRLRRGRLAAGGPADLRRAAAAPPGRPGAPGSCTPTGSTGSSSSTSTSCSTLAPSRWCRPRGCGWRSPRCSCSSSAACSTSSRTCHPSRSTPSAGSG